MIYSESPRTLETLAPEKGGDPRSGEDLTVCEGSRYVYNLLLRNYCTEFLAKLVKLLEHLFCKSVVECLLVALRMVGLVLEIVVKIYSLINYLSDVVSILVWVKRYEKRAVINELSYEVLDVFLENSKVHIVKN